MVKKLMVRVSDEQNEFFDEKCTTEVDNDAYHILNIFEPRNKLVASFYNWSYWRYMDEK